MAAATSPEPSLSKSVDGLVMCVCADDMDDGERLRELAEEAVDGAYWEGGLIICHLGSWNCCFTDTLLMTLGDGSADD